MNDLLQLKGVFQQVKNTAGFGNPELPPKKSVDVAHLINLRIYMIIGLLIRP